MRARERMGRPARALTLSRAPRAARCCPRLPACPPTRTHTPAPLPPQLTSRGACPAEPTLCALQATRMEWLEITHMTLTLGDVPTLQACVCCTAQGAAQLARVDDWRCCGGARPARRP